MVYCQICKKNIATVHYTEIDADYTVKKETHMCESCAQTHDLEAAQPKTISPFKVIESLIKPNLPKHLKILLETRCEQCGMTYPEFRAAGRLGCPHDYHVFKEGIQNVLEQVHGGARRHLGKVPRRAGDAIRLETRRAALRGELEQAIAVEDYERAAELRDALRSIEEEIQGGGTSADEA
ncbi:MAG: UvrB/UvrC motif-containing protein [Planctomycetes bacterium]|nr:UvrB/UvrC motif-containing protein [Planctomycetota bacterium]